MARRLTCHENASTDGPSVLEQASRAAPKIQLVIALVLVPAVLLLVVAVLVANADRLIGAAFGAG